MEAVVETEVAVAVVKAAVAMRILIEVGLALAMKFAAEMRFVVALEAAIEMKSALVVRKIVLAVMKFAAEMRALLKLNRDRILIISQGTVHLSRAFKMYSIGTFCYP